MPPNKSQRFHAAESRDQAVREPRRTTRLGYAEAKKRSDKIQ